MEITLFKNTAHQSDSGLRDFQYKYFISSILVTTDIIYDQSPKLLSTKRIVTKLDYF